MKLLCIETSTDICSVCLSSNNDIVAIKESEKAFSHSESIAVFIEEILKDVNWKISDLDVIGLTEGPGSYTALRIGSSFAKGLCYGQNIPLITIPTLDALANSIKKSTGKNELIIPLLDARRMEVYRTIYDRELNIIEPLSPLVLEEDSFRYLSDFNKIHFVGDGVSKSKDFLKLDNAHFHSIEASSKYMIDLIMDKYEKNEFADISYFEPNYFKKPNIKKSKKKLL